MFALFELAKVLQFANDHAEESVKLLSHAWKEDEKRALLALYLSNGYLLLWGLRAENPVARQLSWFRNRHILCMCCDPSASWLLCCVKDSLIIVPVLSLLDPQSEVPSTWAKSDITEIKIPRMRGQPNTCVWWKTYRNEPIAVLATDASHIYFINLKMKKVVHELRMLEPASNITLVCDGYRKASSSLLITTKGNIQWRLLLEQFANGSEVGICNGQDSDNYGSHRHTSCVSILDKQEDLLEEMTPKELYRFPPSVMLSMPCIKKETFIATYDLCTNVLQVFDSNMGPSPLYIYHLPDTTSNVLVTKNLLFLTSIDKSHILSVVANQLAEAVPNKSNKNQAVIQQFHLPKNEEILYLDRASFLSHHVNPGRESVSEHWITETCQNVLPDGCVLLTNKALYFCRPRLSPVALFLRLVYRDDRLMEAERLAYILRLDVNCLYTAAAERFLMDGNCTKAMSLLDKVKYPGLERVQLMLKHGFVGEALLVLHPMLNGNVSAQLTLKECSLVAKYAMSCYVHQITNGRTELQDEFRNFLFTNYYIDKIEALHLLLRAGLHEFFVEFVMERDVLMEGMMILLNYKTLDEENPCYSVVQIHCHSSCDKQIADDLLWFLNSHKLITLLEDDYIYAERIASLLENCLSDFSEQQLVKVVTTLDFSRPVWNKWCHMVLMKKSTRSMTGNSDEGIHVCHCQENSETKAFRSLVRLLVLALLYLNKKRHYSDSILSDLKLELVEPKKSEMCVKPSALREYVFTKPALLSCGADFVALIKHGYLYTWGCAADGRLGHGEPSTIYICSPQRVKLFYQLGIRVLSVSCGGRHCISLTENGVYAWGSNCYGQLGTSTQTSSSVPLHVVYLDKQKVASVVSGEYHSLALTHDFRVFSWGWGVHGQLGHGNPEDESSPKYIEALQRYRVVMVTAGSTHTAVLTAEGLVYTFGGCNFGQLGTGQTCKSSVPVLVGTLREPVVIITTKYFTTLAVGQSGKLYCWGISPVELKQLMLLLRHRDKENPGKNQPLFNKYLLPHIVYTKHTKGKISKVCCGRGFNSILTDSGAIYTWGVNHDGELGTGDKMEEPMPHQVQRLSETKLVGAAAGPNFIIVIDDCGSLFGWGNNDYGQLAVRPHQPRWQSHNKVSGLLGWPYLSRMRDTNSIVEPVHINTLAATTNTHKQKEAFSQDEKGQEWWLETLTWLPSLLSSDAILPDLTGEGSVIYPPEAIIQVVTHLSQWCSHQEVLDLSVHVEAWDVAARMSWLVHNHIQAFEYHLHFVASLKRQLDAELESSVLQCLHHYIQLLPKQNTVEIVSFCNIIVTFWQVEGLAISTLQKFIREFQNDLAFPFVLCLVEMDKTTAFEHDFLMEILTESLRSVNSSNLGLVGNYYYKLLSQATTAVASTDQLDDGRVLFGEQLADFQVQMSFGKEIPVTEDCVSDEVLVFSCGHRVTRDILHPSVLSELEKQHNESMLPQRDMLSGLAGHYRLQGRLNVACPDCVYARLVNLLKVNNL